MPGQDISGDLLDSLRRLYARIAARLLAWRMQRYRKEPLPGAVPDVQSALGRAAAISVPGGGQNDQASEPPVDAADDAALKAANPLYKTLILEEALTDLSDHFKDGPAFVLDKGVAQRMRESTWHHIHMALRAARNGDDQAARLHADIANNALRECGHYLDEAAYHALVSEVGDYLDANPV